MDHQLQEGHPVLILVVGRVQAASEVNALELARGIFLLLLLGEYFEVRRRRTASALIIEAAGSFSGSKFDLSLIYKRGS